MQENTGVEWSVCYILLWYSVEKRVPSIVKSEDSTSLGAAPSRLKLNYLKILKQTLWRIFFGNSIYCVHIRILQCISCFNIKISEMVCRVRVSGWVTMGSLSFMKTLQNFLLIASEIITKLNVKNYIWSWYREMLLNAIFTLDFKERYYQAF